MKARQAFILPGLVLAMVSGIPGISGAAPKPNGTTFKVSSCDTCQKRWPAVAGVNAGAVAGAFLTSWESRTPADPFGISARFFTKAAAAAGPDILVNKDTVPTQRTPGVATDAQGNYAVVWSAQDGLNSDVLVQLYKNTGAAVGTAQLVNVDNPASPEPPVDVAPAVAMAANGTFVVTWIRSVPPDAHSPGTLPAVMVRRYTAAGVAVGPPVQLSTGLVLATRPEACIDSTGRAVVTWTSADQIRPFEPSKAGVTLRRVTAAGAPAEPEIVVAPPLASESTAGVICGAGGTFTVVWSTDKAPAVNGLDIVAQRFTTLGKRNGATFRINSTITGDQNQPAIASDASGNFVVTWRTHSDTGTPVDGIYARRFLASGTADGSDFVVHNRASRQEPTPLNPDVATLGAAGFVVVWAQGDDAVLAQRYRLK